MSELDKVIAAVTPPESEDARREARANARRAAVPGDRATRMKASASTLWRRDDPQPGAPNSEESGNAQTAGDYFVHA